MAMLGGHAALTAFLVYMIRCASCKTGLVRRHVLLSDDIIDQLLDDAQINRIVTKNLDKRRRPPIARFRHARLDGVTVSNMDKLRFASIWTPGHTTLSKDIKQWEQWLATHWVRCSAYASKGTTRTVEQQMEDARARESASSEDVEDEDEEAELEAEVDREMEGVQEQQDDDAMEQEQQGNDDLEHLNQQGLALLRKQYPDRDDHADMWAGGLDEEGALEGCNVVHVMALGPGRELLGFVKALVTSLEIFVDEVLVSERARGMALSSHLLLRLMEMYPKVRQVRLQVKDDNGVAVRLYSYNVAKERESAQAKEEGRAPASWCSSQKPSWGMSEWRERKTGRFQKLIVEPGCSFLEGTRKAVWEGATRVAGARPLTSDSVVQRFWTSASSEIDGVDLDCVQLPRVPDDAADDSDEPPPLDPEVREEGREGEGREGGECGE